MKKQTKTFKNQKKPKPQTNTRIHTSERARRLRFDHALATLSALFSASSSASSIRVPRNSLLLGNGTRNAIREVASLLTAQRMRPDPSTFDHPYTADDNIMETYQMCQLARDDSFGWPLQEPGLEAELRDMDMSVFDLEQHDDWNKPWSLKTEQDRVAESAWQHLSINLKAPALSGRETSLTPVLAALDIPKAVFAEMAPLAAAEVYQQHCKAVEQRLAEEAASELHLANNNHLHQQQQQQHHHHHQNVYPVVQMPLPVTNSTPQPLLMDPESVITIGTYTRAERAAKLERFRKKRERRNFTKRVLYGCRKQFADSRPRVGGRFVVNENRVVKPKTFLKRGRPRKVQLPVADCLPGFLCTS